MILINFEISNKNIIKMRSKKPRKINVDNQKYLWKISKYNCDGDGGFYIRIWKCGKMIVEEYRTGIDAQVVTPKNIRDLILNENNMR
jgi:RNA binding exosome subunit